MYKLIAHGTAWRIVRSLEGQQSSRPAKDVYRTYKEAKLALLDRYELEDY